MGLGALIVGLVLSGARPWTIGLALAVGLVLAGVAALGGHSRRAGAALAASALLLGGAWAGTERSRAIDRSMLGPLMGGTVVARGYVVRNERPIHGARRFRMRLTRISRPQGGGSRQRLDELVQVEVGAAVRAPELAVGDEALVEGVLRRPADRAHASFDYAAYLRRAGVHALVQADAVVATGRGRGGLAGLLDSVRRRAEAGVAAGLPPPLAALARGIVLGEDERIPAGMAEDFKTSGLAHLLAVSGQNVTLLAVLALPLLAAVGLRRRMRLVGVLALIAIYVPLAGAGPSIMRAGAMGAAATLAMLAGRPGSRWYGLLLAAAFTLVIDPRAWLDAGWQLSFAAVIGIFCLVPPLRRALRRLPPPLADGAAVTVAATLATAPLMAFHFERVSAVSLLANLVALPVVAPIMWLGMLAAAASQVSPAPAFLLNGANGFCLAYLAAVAGWSAALPHSALGVRIGSPLALAAVYAVPALLLAALRRARRRSIGARLGRGQARAAVAVAALAAAALAAAAGFGLHTRAPGSPERFTASFLDVGQGDATLLQAPGGVSVLVDGGPPQSDVVAKLRAAGVRSLYLAVLTHAQEDHEGGLEAVVRNLPVAVLLDGGSGSRDPIHRRIVALARERGTRVVVAHAGQAFRVGALRLQVLGPTEASAAVADDPNQRAVVLLASYSWLDVFLPADAESDATLGLSLRPVEVLKVAHHGSEDEGLPSLLDRLRPRVAVIEVGARNRYGHPRSSTLQALRAAVPSVFRTDRDGDVKVSLAGPRLIVQPVD